MSVLDAPLQPLLQRYPDARAARVALVEPLLLPYVALMFGSSAAAVVAAYNSVAVGRRGRAVLSIAIGIAGWLAFAAVVIVAESHPWWNVQLAILAGRTIHFLLGGVLFFQQRRIAHGHAFLGGRMAPLRASYVLAFVLVFTIPNALLALMLGVPPGR